MKQQNRQLPNQMSQTIARWNMVKPGQRVLCAVSGGADSVAMAHAMMALGYEICLCHVEHGIRGDASVEDMRFVQQLARDWGVGFYGKRVDAPREAKRMGVSLEAAARSLRYDFFAQALVKSGADVCATAHHLGDQAETILLRLSRGALDALQGIPYVNGPFIRPMRDATKEQILDYLTACHLPWREDATNQDLDVARNRVRQQVLPAMEKINPRAPQNLVRSMDLVAQDAAVLDEQAARIVLGQTLPLKMLAPLPLPIARRVLLRFAQNAGARQMDQKHLEALMHLSQTGASVDLKGVSILCDGQVLRAKRPSIENFCVPLCLYGRTSTPVGELYASEIPPPRDAKTPPCEQCFDLDKLLPLQPVVRNRREGDVILPIGAGGSQKLKELFIDKKIPKDLRSRIPLIADGGDVLWAAGVCASQHIAVDKDTKRVLHIKYIFKEEL